MQLVTLLPIFLLFLYAAVAVAFFVLVVAIVRIGRAVTAINRSMEELAAAVRAQSQGGVGARPDERSE